MRNALGRLDQGVMFRRLRVRADVEAAAHALELPLVDKTPESGERSEHLARVE